MSDYFKVLLLAELAAGYTVLFLWISRESILRQLWHRAYDSLETAAARRVRDNRRSLQMLRAKRGFWQRMELRLLYSGISWRQAWRFIFWRYCWAQPGRGLCWRRAVCGC